MLARTGALDYARACAARESEAAADVRGRAARLAGPAESATIGGFRGPSHVLSGPVASAAERRLPAADDTGFGV